MPKTSLILLTNYDLKAETFNLDLGFIIVCKYVKDALS